MSEEIDGDIPFRFVMRHPQTGVETYGPWIKPSEMRKAWQETFGKFKTMDDLQRELLRIAREQDI